MVIFLSSAAACRNGIPLILVLELNYYQGFYSLTKLMPLKKKAKGHGLIKTSFQTTLGNAIHGDVFTFWI